MFCTYCGVEINDEAVVCPHCGCPVRSNFSLEQNKKTENNGETLGIVAIVTALFCPIASWICGAIGLDFAKKADNKHAKTLNIIGLSIASGGFVIEVIVCIVFFIAFFLGIYLT